MCICVCMYGGVGANCNKVGRNGDKTGRRQMMQKREEREQEKHL